MFGLNSSQIPFAEPVNVGVGDSFSGLLPGWGSGELVALVSASVLKNETITETVIELMETVDVVYQRLVLDHESLVDQTSRVDTDSGSVNISFPASHGGDESQHAVFAFYQRLSGHKNLKFESTSHGSIFDNGSYVVDHFDARGAQTVRSCWEEHVLTNEVRELLKLVGNYGKATSTSIESHLIQESR